METTATTERRSTKPASSRPAPGQRVYVQLRVYDPTVRRMRHVRGANLIFERITVKDVHRLIVKAAEQHYRRTAAIPPKGAKTQ